VATSRFTKTEALVLKQAPLGEADRVLTLFTAGHGKLRAVARGVRRPRSRMAGHVEPLVYCRLMLVRGHALPVVAGVETVRGFPLLRRDLEATARARVCAELVDAFSPEEQPNPPVLALLLEVLEWLEAGEGDRLLRYFELQLLQRVGYMPELYHCVGCKAAVLPDQHAFSPSMGGVVCLSCVASGVPGAPVLPLSLNALKVLRHFLGHSYQEVRGLHLKPPLAKELEGLTGGYITYLLERQRKAPAFLESLRSAGAR
jgi:DNA repair protein RecO (recombination protein O)